ncbi:hypothetical protein TOTORO_02150 [Serratia phage vB_SmaS-Totoro]|nr:hypothetical protein TOTORO_02150 [Serratia phage vB_SmaS-Totoro]
MDAELGLMDYLLKFPPYVIEGLEIDRSNPVLLHISPNPTIREFIPRPIQRTMKGEDEYVPRVCTGVGLLDCLRGYAVAINDFLKKEATCAGDDDWLGGYTIYSIPAEIALKPSPRMAPISKWCEERWLVPYEGPSQPYIPTAVGKFFINDVMLTEDKTIIPEIYLHVEKGPMIFDRHLTLYPGYWRVIIPNLNSYFEEKFRREDLVVEKLAPEKFNVSKQSKAHLLSYDINSFIKRW